MSARRCPVCLINWPDEWKEYRECPQCEGKTDRVTNADAIDAAEALSWKRHCEFGRYCEAREAKMLAAEIEAFERGAV